MLFPGNVILRREKEGWGGMVLSDLYLQCVCVYSFLQLVELVLSICMYRTMYDRWTSPPDHKLGWRWWRRWWSLTLIGLWSEHALLQYSVMCTAQHNSSQTACTAAMPALITALFEVEHFCYSRSCFEQLRYFIIVDALWKSAALCRYCWCFWLTGVLWY